jgi:hypothetical protein
LSLYFLKKKKKNEKKKQNNWALGPFGATSVGHLRVAQPPPFGHPYFYFYFLKINLLFVSLIRGNFEKFKQKMQILRM